MPLYVLSTLVILFVQLSCNHIYENQMPKVKLKTLLFADLTSILLALASANFLCLTVSD